jgi:hypothetical protein
MPQVGRPKKPLAERALTNARIRLPENVVMLAPQPVPQPPVDQPGVEGWSPSGADLVGLDQVEKRFVSEFVQVHVLNHREGIILLAAARCRGNAARWHRRAKKTGPDQARYARLALSFEKQFSVLIGQLKVTP